MMINNLHKWFIQRKGVLCADAILLIGATVYLGLTIWAIDAWLARDRVCTRLESEATEKKTSYLQQQMLDARAKAEREEWRKKVLAERPQTARIMAVQWNDAGRNQKNSEPGTRRRAKHEQR